MHEPGDKDQTLVDGLLRQARQQPDAPAYSAVYRDGRRVLTFGDLERQSNQIAHALQAAGVGRGDRVACLTKRHIDGLLLTLAACKLGAVCMPVNWRLAADEIRFILDNGEAKLLLVDTAFAAAARGAASDQLQTVLCTEGPGQGDAAGLPGWAQWYAGQPSSFNPVACATGDAALQLYSSGTTGLPKGVVLSHAGLLNTSRTVMQGWGFAPDGVMCNVLPNFHVAGMTMMFLTLYAGAQSVTMDEFDPAVFVSSLTSLNVTHVFLVPAMLLFALQVPGAATRGYPKLKQIAYGGSPISERVLKEAMDAFGCDFLQVYGLTEVSGPATFLSPEDHRAAAQRPELLRSAGRPAASTRLRIVDPVSQQDLPEGQTGEVWIETPRNLIGYWRNAEATAQVFPEGRNADGGWFRSGDGGYIKDGYLFINDRIKDMIISGGENIYPAEIENLLMQHPSVADCAVIGVPDARWGEAVKACVVAQAGAGTQTEDGAAIIGWMRERLAHFKCPKSVDFVDVLPRNPTGKLLKRVLRQPYWDGAQRGVA